VSVVPLRLKPLVRVEKWSAGWIVSVRPCPDDIASMRNFMTETEAAEYAAELQREHGFRVRPERYRIDEPGEAA
jgi:hypothetical protein